MKPVRILLLLVLLLVGQSASGLPQPCIACVVRPYVELKVESITPQQGVIEHEPVDVAVSATLRSVASNTPPFQGMVCVRSDTPTCEAVTLNRNVTVRRTLHTSAPAAGAGVRMEVFYCEPEAPDNICRERSSALADQPLAVAARYELILQDFEILHTRARTNDTVEVSLAAIAGKPISADSSLCDIVGPPTYCVKPVAQGDHADGSHVVRGDVRVGPFTLVPETDPDLNMLYVVTNHGHSYNEKAYLAFMNLMNTFGAGIYSALDQSGSSDLKDGTETLNNAMAQDCDGVVVSDTKTLLNRTIEGQYASTIDAHTQQNGYWQHQSEIYTTPNNTNCGDSSKYRVTWRLARTSWQPSGGVTQERIELPVLSDEQGPRYCPRGSALSGVRCTGRFCDNLLLACTRYSPDTPLGHRDIDAHNWSGWYSEENGGHPPEWAGPDPVTGFITGVDCRGDYCDDIRVDADTGLTPQSAGNKIATISEEDPQAQCPAGQFVTKLLCSGSNCDNVSVWCSN